MCKLEYYMEDGAGWQAQAVLAYLKYGRNIILDGYFGTEYYDMISFRVGRFENDRDQGYVLTVGLGVQKTISYAFFGHRNGDSIVVYKQECGNIYGDTPRWESMYGERDKFEYDKSFDFGEITNCGWWILSDAKKELDKYIEETNKK